MPEKLVTTDAREEIKQSINDWGAQKINLSTRRAGNDKEYLSELLEKFDT